MLAPVSLGSVMWTGFDGKVLSLFYGASIRRLTRSLDSAQRWCMMLAGGPACQPASQGFSLAGARLAPYMNAPGDEVKPQHLLLIVQESSCIYLLCVRACAMVHAKGSKHNLPPCELQELSSGYWAWQQAPLPAEPSHRVGL